MSSLPVYSFNYEKLVTKSDLDPTIENNLINYENKNRELNVYSNFKHSSHFTKREKKTPGNYEYYRSPLNIGLYVSIPGTSSLSSDSSRLKLSISSPTEGTKLFRGNTITVSGVLRSAAPNDFWDGETVEIYYNLTEAEFKVDPDSYRSSNYYVTSVVTNSQGEFTATISTSTLSADFRSKVGNITIFTWFDGNPDKGRGSGSPGSSYVFVYGGLKTDVSYSVTNPNQPYSFTTRILFDNNTEVTTSGTQYHIQVTWLTDNRVDINGNFTFTTNSHTYSNTSPSTIQTVKYESYYDSSQLSLNFFVTTGDTSFSNKLLHAVKQATTSEQVVVSSYYVTGTGLTDADIAIPLDSYITVYANVSDSSGLVGAGYNVTLEFYHGTTRYNLTTIQTNSSGAIQTKHFVDHNNIADITINNAFYITMTVSSSEFGGADVTPDSLGSVLESIINSISISISNTTIFYTSGKSISYTVTVTDNFGRVAPLAQFQVDFPGLSVITSSTGSSGTKTLSSVIPSYTIHTQTKTINVTALFTDGGTYRYFLNGTPQNNDTFNIYFDLTLTLQGPYDSNIVDGESTSYFNNTYYSFFQTGNIYNLTVVDEWGRNPVGAPFSLNFEGQTVSGVVTSGNNFIELDPDFNPTTGVDINVPTTISLVAEAGEANYQSSISHTVSIYGPDLDAPVINGETLSPNPFTTASHEPFFNVSFSISVSDVGSGVRSVIIYYQVIESNDSSLLNPANWITLNLTDLGGGIWFGYINTTIDFALQYVHYYIEVKDYAGYGLQENGTRQPTAQYDENFGLTGYLYNETHTNYYQLGDYEPPVEVAVPTTVDSPDPKSPYLNITVYVNDSLIYTGVSQVLIYINRTAVGGTTEINWVNGVQMTNIPGTNAWFYQLLAEYNYQYSWYYVAYDNAEPSPRTFKSQTYTYEAIDDTPPIIYNIDVVPSTGLLWNSTMNFTIRVDDVQNEVENVTLFITLTDPNGVEVENEAIALTAQAGTIIYSYTLDLSVFNYSVYGGYLLEYHFYVEDTIGNNISTTSVQLAISNPAPPNRPPVGDPADPSSETPIGGIVGGAIGGIVALIVILFLWFNRHSLRSYAQQQTLRKRLRDYLREILEDIKRLGSESRYKEAVLKTWQVIEGVGREFFDTPRFRHQTPMEYATVLSRRGKIDMAILNTLSEYFEKARYGAEVITETDFNATISALMKIINQLEAGEMEIET